jgi:hypothetical protein
MFTYGAASGLFSNWNAKADLEDTRNVAIDQATVAILQMQAPEMTRLTSTTISPSPLNAY